jgi:hypothetical protein
MDLKLISAGVCMPPATTNATLNVCIVTSNQFVNVQLMKHPAA